MQHNMNYCKDYEYISPNMLTIINMISINIFNDERINLEELLEPQYPRKYRRNSKM